MFIKLVSIGFDTYRFADTESETVFRSFGGYDHCTYDEVAAWGAADFRAFGKIHKLRFECPESAQ